MLSSCGKRRGSRWQVCQEDRGVAFGAACAVAADFAEGALVCDAQADHQLLRGMPHGSLDNTFAAWSDRRHFAVAGGFFDVQSAEQGLRCGTGIQADQRGVDNQLVMKPDAPGCSLWIDRGTEPAGLNLKFNANATIR